MNYSVYALGDPATGKTRYIGIAHDVYRRYAQHLNHPHHNETKNAWMDDIKQRGVIPTLTILESDISDILIFEREKHWISYYLSQGHPLTNILHGKVEGKEGMRYSGYCFKSAVKARYARFLDILGVPYTYHPDKYDAFWLPEQDCWLEIKSQNLSEQERGEMHKLAMSTQKSAFAFFGEFEPFQQYIDPSTYDVQFRGMRGHAFLFREEGTWQGFMKKESICFDDTFYMFGECPMCHVLTISFWGCPGVVSKEDGDALFHTINQCRCSGLASMESAYNTRRLTSAYTAARQ